MIKFNVGSHNKRIEGYVNIDALNLENVDYICDITQTPWNVLNKKVTKYIDIHENLADEILMIEVLEHISFRKTDEVLKECYRVLKKGGKLIIQVPDCGEMMKAYCNGTISEIIPHKPKNNEQVEKIREKTGYVVHPNRWLFAFLGAQKHEFDAHLNIFTKERMEEYLENAGFSEIKFLDDPINWKIKVLAIK